MMKVCICCNRKYPDGNITFHKIPSDKERRQKWLNAIKLPHKYANKNSYLCSEHFAEDTFCCQIVNKVVHRFLYINAIPSIFKEKQSQHSDIETTLSNHINSITDGQSSSVEVSEEFDEEVDDDEEEEGDCYYYKVENGIIKRYLQKDLNNPDLLSSSKQESFSKTNDVNLEENLYPKCEKLVHNLNNENTSVVNSKVHIEAPVKVEVLPNIQLPIPIRNEEIYSKDIICDFKINEFSNDHQPNIIYEEIRMDAEEIPYDQDIEFSNINGINEVEVTTSESEPIELVQQLTTSVLENEDIKEEEVKNYMDNLCKDSIVNNDADTILSQKNDNFKLDHIIKKSPEIREKYMKKLLHECLEKNKSSYMNSKLKNCTKFTLSELLKTALNYIECLEEKLKVSVEKNNQYEHQISEFKNLLEFIDNSDKNKIT